MQEAPPKKLCCSPRDLRTRSVALAETGNFETWEAVALALEAENCPGAVMRIGGDVKLQQDLTALCRPRARQEEGIEPRSIQHKFPAPP